MRHGGRECVTTDTAARQIGSYLAVTAGGDWLLYFAGRTANKALNNCCLSCSFRFCS